ncbi:MAG: helix-turn-helix domain-containing protein [Myxococcales bacterium]|nr:helix-turn-helix domain-containing protein [Myxococcales bacterium]
MSAARPYLTTAEAARYLGYRDGSALRKAKLEGRIQPVGRRGGRGTLMWAQDDLDAFLRGEAPRTLDPERPGAPPQGATDEKDGMEAEVEQLGRPAAVFAGGLSPEGGRTPRARAIPRPALGEEERDQIDVAGGDGPARRAKAVTGRARRRGERGRIESSDAALLRLRRVVAGTKDHDR